jgi:tRNA(Ile)-lysidine synthase
MARVAKEAMGLTYRPAAPRAIALRVVARIIEEKGQVARLFDALCARQVAMLGNVVARGGPAGWSFARAPRRKAKGGRSRLQSCRFSLGRRLPMGFAPLA